ncbi:MAG: YncE family protein, partial [Candidatus Brocadiales bacterium]|nr:YncE family protein [Candidatus Brocadiales bacterium]
MKGKNIFIGVVSGAVLCLALTITQSAQAGFIQGTRVKTEHPSPFHVSASPDGSTLFVVNQSGHSVTLVDAKAQKVIGEVPVETQPESAACTPDGKTLYVCNAEDDSVSVVDVAKKAAIKKIKVGDWPCSVKVSKDGSKAYVSCSGNLWNKVDIIDTSKNERVGEITVGYGPRDIAISPDGRQMAVICDTVGSINRTVDFVDLSANKVTESRVLRHSANLRGVAY